MKPLDLPQEVGLSQSSLSIKSVADEYIGVVEQRVSEPDSSLDYFAWLLLTRSRHHSTLEDGGKSGL